MQSHFTGSSMYSTGGQQGFGSPGFGGNMVQGTQNFGGQAGGQQGFYPVWFAQYTGRQPMQIDQLIQMQFQQTVSLPSLPLPPPHRCGLPQISGYFLR